MANWLDLSNNANTFKSSYFDGFIDVSGTIQNRNANDRLIICGDASLKSELSIAKRLFVSDIEIGHGGNNLATNLTIGTNILGNAVTTTFASDENVAIGFNVLQNAAKTTNDHTYDNVAIGYDSMANATAGDTNVAIGKLAMGQTQATFSSNVAVGFWALKGASGNNSRVLHTVGIGYSAGQNIIGSYNTLIGNNTGARNSNTIEYSTAIGYAAKFDDSNQIMLGRSSEKVVIPGDASFNNHLFVNGVGTFSAPPVCSVAATSNNQLVNKSYVDTNSALLGADNTFTGETTVFDNKVGIGIDNPQRNLTIYHADNPAIQLTNSSSGTGSTDGMAVEQYGLSSYITNKENGNIHFRTMGDTIRLTIQENGQFGMGNSGNVFTTQNNVLSLDPVNSPGGDALGVRSANDAYNIINFYNLAGSHRGSIQGVNSTSIQYNTTSDRRLKTDITTLQDGLAKVMKLKPRTYRWKENGDLADGFVAQEVFEVLPHFIPQNRFKCNISQNDVYHGKVCPCCDIETKSNGEDYIFGLDYSTFTPYLCKAIQDQQTIIETEKAKTASLEAQVASLLERVTALES